MGDKKEFWNLKAHGQKRFTERFHVPLTHDDYNKLLWGIQNKNKQKGVICTFIGNITLSRDLYMFSINDVDGVAVYNTKIKAIATFLTFEMSQNISYRD